MKISPRAYAKAFIGILKGKSAVEQKKMFRRLLGIISKKGDTKQLGPIMREVERLYFASQKKKKVVIESNNPVSELVKREVKHLLGDVSIIEKLNPALLAGIKILINDEVLIDASAAAQLKKLFRS